MANDAIYNFLGVVTGVLGVVAPIIAIIHKQLPSNTLRKFDDLWEETDSLLRSVSEEGLFSGSTFLSARTSKLSDIHERAENVRIRSYAAKTIVQQYVQLCRGLSGKIALLTAEVLDIRAEVFTVSAQERERVRQSTSSNSRVSDVNPEDDSRTLCSRVDVTDEKCEDAEASSSGEDNQEFESESEPAATGSVATTSEGDSNNQTLYGVRRSLLQMAQILFLPSGESPQRPIR